MYRALGATMQTDPTWSTYIITSMEYFESLFGRKGRQKEKAVQRAHQNGLLSV